ncbi:MAG: NAD(P)H-hydrate epimerase, partial [Saprospiraceae bacterium]
MKILSAPQIKELDAYTIANEPIASIDLMERAAQTFVDWFVQKFPDEDTPVYIFCGPGNNGGDGLAAARLLQQRFYTITVYACQIGSDATEDFQKNWQRLPRKTEMKIFSIWQDDYLPELPENSIVIDAIFGSGLNRPIEGYWADLVAYLNDQPVTRVAIDIPSGLYADRHTEGVCIRAHYTFTFEMPKLAFVFPENYDKVGEWYYHSIQLHPDFIHKTPSQYYYLDKNMIRRFLHRRQKYDHKGTYGHALLIVGSYGKIGAAILA